MDIATYALCKKLVGNVKGEKGDAGEKGDTGVTPNLQVGNVTTLPAGQNATITQSGTKENPIFSFAIPKGDKGIFIGSKDDAPLDADIVIDHSDGGLFPGGNDKLIEVPIIDATLTLTTDKYQTTAMEDNVTIILPNVNSFTEIHLFFYATDNLTLTIPNVGWQSEPNIELGKTYEFIFTYTTEWLGGNVSYDTPPKAPIMNGLVGWFDAKDLIANSNSMVANDTVWVNRVKGGVDAIIKTISGNEVQGKDGDYFRTNRNAYVVLPSFEANNTDGLSIFLDAKLNQKPIERYNRVFTLGKGAHYAEHLTLEGGTESFGKIGNFGGASTESILGGVSAVDFPIQMKIGVNMKDNTGNAKNYANNLGTTFSLPNYNATFNNNFLCAETTSMLSKADISYGLVLIYNRALTEKEVEYNYKYSLTIQRGLTTNA